MARIIRFNPDRHQGAQALLPWYITGQLDDEERARLEAHLHECVECQAELRAERRLAGAIAELPYDTDQGWSEMRSRILAQAEPRRPLKRLAQALAGPGRAGWTLAAQFVAALVIVSLALPITQRPHYHTLGAVRPAPAGDVIVIFRQDARAADITQALRSSGARLVDGPTEADAYVLDVPRPRRAAALARLRGDGAVTLAEAIEPVERP